MKSFQQSPEQWINALRLSDGKTIMEQGAQVKTAAHALNYKHSQSFSRAFRQFFGFSPSSIPASRPSKPFSSDIS
jgi:AraC-like DNA-binding protein